MARVVIPWRHEPLEGVVYRYATLKSPLPGRLPTCLQCGAWQTRWFPKVGGKFRFSEWRRAYL